MRAIHVLLVDDGEEFVNTLAERLELRGFVPETAYDGEQALLMIEKTRFDVVVLDLMMPGLSGIEVLKQVKVRQPELPVILLTGYGSTREGMDGMRHGAYDYLMKPLDIDQLIPVLEAAVGEKSGSLQ